MQGRIGRPTFAQIDGDALRRNVATLRAQFSPGVSLLAVVKANAYGHGAAQVAPLFQRAGVDAFGVATVAEGVEIRQAGITRPILVLTGAGGHEIDAVLEHQLSVAILDYQMARELQAALRGRSLSTHIKVDTGMGRVGTRPDELPELLALLHGAPELSVVGVFSHFANADGGNEEFVASQLRLFRQALDIVHAAGWQPPHVHIANSAAALTRPTAHFTMARPGIALYGVPPMANCPVHLQPAMRLVTQIVQLKSVPAEYPLSYGQTFVTRRPSRIATLPIGYADGYDRGLSNRAFVLVRGRRAPVVGTICMDLTLIDVTDVADVTHHDEVVLWGEQSGAVIGVDEVAAWQGSVSYEVLTRLGPRVPRVLRTEEGVANG